MPGEQNEQEMSMEEILASIRKIIATDDDMESQEGKPAASANVAPPAPAETGAPVKLETALPVDQDVPSPPAPAIPATSTPVETETSPVVAALEEDDFLELTEEVHNDGSVRDVKAMHQGGAPLSQPMPVPSTNEGLMTGLSSIMDEAAGKEVLERETEGDHDIEEAALALEKERTRHDVEEAFGQERHREAHPHFQHEGERHEETEIREAMTEKLENDIISGEAAMVASSSLKGLKETIERKVREDEAARAITIDSLVTEAIKPMLKEWLDANLPSLVEKIVEKEIQRFVEKSMG